MQNQHTTASPERFYIEAIALALFIVLITGLALPFEDRLLNDISVWIKPQKFAWSLALHSLTIILLARLILTTDQLKSALWRWTAMAYLTGSLVELLWITLQAARGRASHFNESTGFESAMYTVMAVGAIALVVAPMVLSYLASKNTNISERPFLRQSIIAGCLLSSISTLIVAFYLGGSMSHWVGDIQSDAQGLPIVGWSTQVGDLRVAHFFATHALQIIPFVGWIMAHQKVRILHAMLVAYSLLIVGTFVQALMGYPLIAMT